MQQESTVVEQEEWKQVTSNELYVVSNYGRVQSQISGKILTPRNHTGGYVQYCMASPNGDKYAYAHSLVAAAFIGPRPDGYEINHKDGNKKNNFVGNLEYCTSSENKRHAFANGLNSPPMKGVFGDANPRTKIKTDRYVDVMQMVACGLPSQKIANQFGVCRTLIANITMECFGRSLKGAARIMAAREWLEANANHAGM